MFSFSLLTRGRNAPFTGAYEYMKAQKNIRLDIVAELAETDVVDGSALEWGGERGNFELPPTSSSYSCSYGVYVNSVDAQQCIILILYYELYAMLSAIMSTYYVPHRDKALGSTPSQGTWLLSAHSSGDAPNKDVLKFKNQSTVII